MCLTHCIHDWYPPPSRSLSHTCASKMLRGIGSCWLTFTRIYYVFCIAERVIAGDRSCHPGSNCALRPFGGTSYGGGCHKDERAGKEHEGNRLIGVDILSPRCS
jgi:hypothetical protein